MHCHRNSALRAREGEGPPVIGRELANKPSSGRWQPIANSIAVFGKSLPLVDYRHVLSCIFNRLLHRLIHQILAFCLQVDC